MYQEEEMKKRKVYDYELNDAKMMNEYREKMKEKRETERPQTTDMKGEGDTYKPGTWNAATKKKPDSDDNKSM